MDLSAATAAPKYQNFKDLIINSNEVYDMKKKITFLPCYTVSLFQVNPT